MSQAIRPPELNPPANSGMLSLTREEMETLRRRLINALAAIEEALGCESSLKTRTERRHK